MISNFTTGSWSSRGEFNSHLGGRSSGPYALDDDCMVGREGLEPSTSALKGRYVASNTYVPKLVDRHGIEPCSSG